MSVDGLSADAPPSPSCVTATGCSASSTAMAQQSSRFDGHRRRPACPHTLLRHYYREGGVQLTEDDRALRAYLNLPQFGFFLAEASKASAEPAKR